MPESTILPINKAKAIAEDWAVRLQSLPEVSDCVIAGDIRRWCETTEVIDLAVGTADFYKVMNYSAAQPDVASVLAREDHTVSPAASRWGAPAHPHATLRALRQSAGVRDRLGSAPCQAGGRIAQERGMTFSSGNLLSESGQALNFQ